MMLMYCSFSGSTASGASSSRSTVSGPTATALATPASWKARCEVRPSARVIENTTSSALSVLPSWNCTPGRSAKRQRLGSSCCQPVASAGSSLNAASRPTSDS